LPSQEHFAQSASFCEPNSFYRPNAILTLLSLRKFSSNDQSVVYKVSDGVFVLQILDNYKCIQGWPLPMGQPGQSKHSAQPTPRVHKNLQKNNVKLCNIVTATSLLN
jgi:hypothetical protein